MNGILDLPPITKIRKVPDIYITKDIDHECTDNMVCPYCGCSWQVESENYSDYIERKKVEKCEECGMRFIASASCYVYFSTEPVEDIAKSEQSYSRKQEWLDYSADYIRKCQERGINMDGYIKEKSVLINALKHNEKVGHYPVEEEGEQE